MVGLASFCVWGITCSFSSLCLCSVLCRGALFWLWWSYIVGVFRFIDVEVGNVDFSWQLVFWLRSIQGFSAFLDQLRERVSDNIEVAVATDTGHPVEVPQACPTTTRIRLVTIELMVEVVWFKRRPMLKEKIPPPSIAFLKAKLGLFLHYFYWCPLNKARWVSMV